MLTCVLRFRNLVQTPSRGDWAGFICIAGFGWKGGYSTICDCTWGAACCHFPGRLPVKVIGKIQIEISAVTEGYQFGRAVAASRALHPHPGPSRALRGLTAGTAGGAATLLLVPSHSPSPIADRPETPCATARASHYRTLTDYWHRGVPPRPLRSRLPRCQRRGGVGLPRLVGLRP